MQAAGRWTLFTVLAASAAVLAACSASESADAACPEGWDEVTEYRLYFGRSDASGVPDAVSEEAWAQFVDDTITPRFPDGLTVADGAGQWRNNSGEILKEQTKVLIVLVWPDDTSLQRLNEVTVEYESRFAQESVLLTSAPTCAAFS